MARLEYPTHHRVLAAALLRRSVYDLTTRSRTCQDAWHWFFGDQPGPVGWEFEDCTRVLELSAPHLRRALQRAGYTAPPTPIVGGQRQKLPGIIPCRACGTATPTNDIRIQRTCPACGHRLKPQYLRRHGLLSYANGTPPPRTVHATAALRHLLARGPLPVRYVTDQLHRAGFRPRTIRAAQRRLGVHTTCAPIPVLALPDAR